MVYGKFLEDLKISYHEWFTPERYISTVYAINIWLVSSEGRNGFHALFVL